MNLIPNNIGTYPIEQRETILNTLKQTAEKYGVTLWCRGRGGKRKLERTWLCDWIPNRKPFIARSYAHHTPLNKAPQIAVYIRVRPTQKLKKLYGNVYTEHYSAVKIADSVESFFLPVIQKEMKAVLKEKGIIPIKN